MLFLGENYVFFCFLSRRGNSTEPLLNLKTKAPFLFDWVDVQGYLFTFVRELLLTLCAPVRSKMIIIFLTLVLSKDTVQPGGESNIITPCAYLKLLEVMWLHTRRRKSMLSKLQTRTDREYVLRYTTTVQTFTTDHTCFFLYCTLAADGTSNRDNTCSDNGSPIFEDDSGVTGSVPNNSRRISIPIYIHNQQKELICYGPLLWRERLCPIARNGLVQ